MITRLKVKNYRSIEEIDLPLSPLTVLVGKNGAGKSTILDVFAFVRDALSESLASAIKKRGGIGSLLRWTPNDDTVNINIEVEFTDEVVSGSYSFTFCWAEIGGFAIKREHCAIQKPDKASFQITEREGMIYHEENGEEQLRQKVQKVHDELKLPLMAGWGKNGLGYEFVVSLLTDTEVYSIPPDHIRYPQGSEDDTKLWGDGKNLASVLYRLQSDEATFGRIRSGLQQIVPNVEDIRVRELDDYYSISLKHRRKSDAEAWFSLRHESDGTLRALALLTALYQDYTHSCIAIEEPETAIFSRQLGVIADALYEASLRRQVIVTTQSPDLISCFSADDLRIVTEVDGATTAGTLDKTQLRIIEKELFNAGELLRLEGLYSSSIPRGEEVVA